MKWDFIVIFHTYVEGLKLEERIERALQVVISFTTCQKEKVLKTHSVSNVHFMTILSNRGFEGKSGTWYKIGYCCILIDVLQV